jgi:hypothetical protein
MEDRVGVGNNWVVNTKGIRRHPTPLSLNRVSNGCPENHM